MKILVVENLRPDEEIWWYRYLPHKMENCHLTVVKIPEQSLKTSFFPLFRLFWTLGRYDAFITQQDGYATLLLSFLSSLFMRKKTRHYIYNFISRERSAGFYSFMKYAFLRFSLRSVYCIMCAARLEMEYYRNTLKLKKTQFSFVPLTTNPRFVDIIAESGNEYIISSGRTGRDYKTLIEAVRGLPVKLIIVADYHNLAGIESPENVEVIYNIPLSELIKLNSSAMFVVLPLQDRQISVGQSVLLESMALGKAVIATKNAATVDYVEDGRTAILVTPGDHEEMKNAILDLLNNPEKARQIGTEARNAVRENYMMDMNISRICNLLRETNG